MKLNFKGLFAILILLVFAGVGYASASSVKQKAPPTQECKFIALEKIVIYHFSVADYDCQKFELRQLVSWPEQIDVAPVHYGLTKFTSKSHLINNERCSMPQINRCTNTK